MLEDQQLCLDTLSMGRLFNGFKGYPPPNINTVTADFITGLTDDLKIKNDIYKDGQLVTNFKFNMEVEVVTRRLVNGNYVKVNGFKVYATPWLLRNRRPAKIPFANPTNPESREKLPPGKYSLWVVSEKDKTAVFPKDLTEFKRIYYQQDANKAQVFYIDVE
jgi:hypothetical protein